MRAVRAGASAGENETGHIPSTAQGSGRHQKRILFPSGRRANIAFHGRTEREPKRASDEIPGRKDAAREHVMKKALVVCAIGILLAVCGNALAADAGSSAGGRTQQPPAKAQPDTPAALETRSTAVAVIHEGNDSIGARLATRLKETFNASNLFRLEEKNVPKMRLLLNTAAEFPSRPGVGSVYSVIWIFSQSDDHLSYLLAEDLGVLTMDGVDALTYSLLERTDGIGVKYGYLFK
jgi:hypothetical protein